MNTRQLARYLDRLRARVKEGEATATRWGDEGDLFSEQRSLGEAQATRWVIQELESFLQEALNKSEKVHTGKSDE